MRYENTTNVPQVVYNRAGDPVTVKPGETFTEDTTEAEALEAQAEEQYGDYMATIAALRQAK